MEASCYIETGENMQSYAKKTYLSVLELPYYFSQ